MNSEIKMANLAFYFAERLKSNFLIVSAIMGLEDDEPESGKETLQAVLRALRGEISIAKRYIDSRELELAEAKVMEAEGNLRLSTYDEVRKKLSKGLSHITTMDDKPLKILKEKDLV